jgi:threonine dehydrogenase-like Zn-dependent dehydrogenase
MAAPLGCSTTLFADVGEALAVQRCVAALGSEGRRPASPLALGGICGSLGRAVLPAVLALFARLHGAAAIVLVDPTLSRRHVAADLGLEALDPHDADPAVVLKSRWRHGAGDRSADVVFQCRGGANASALALRIVRPQGTVIDLAFYRGGCEEVRLGEEFHHNGPSLRCAQIGRVPRGTSHVWDRDRLSTETSALLAAEGKDIARQIITDYVPLSEAPQTLIRLAGSRHTGLQLVFTSPVRA